MEETGHIRQPLVRITKDGQMRLKNKVAVAILRENTYEDRALKSKLRQIQSYKKRQEQSLTHRQLEFATRRITELEKEEKRPHTIAHHGQTESLDSLEHLPSLSRSNTLVGQEHTTAREATNPKAKWEKAINLVRSAVSQPRNNAPESHGNGAGASHRKGWRFLTEEHKTSGSNNAGLLQGEVKTDERKNIFVVSQQHHGEHILNNQTGHTHNTEAIKTHFKRQDNELNPHKDRKERLPPLNFTAAARDEQHGSLRHSRRRKHREKQLALPELLQVSREKSLLGITDPRFKRLESCLVMKPASLHAHIPDDGFLAFRKKQLIKERKSARKKYKTLTFALPRETQIATPISVESCGS